MGLLDSNKVLEGGRQSLSSIATFTLATAGNITFIDNSAGYDTLIVRPKISNGASHYNDLHNAYLNFALGTSASTASSFTASGHYGTILTSNGKYFRKDIPLSEFLVNNSELYVDISGCPAVRMRYDNYTVGSGTAATMSFEYALVKGQPKQDRGGVQELKRWSLTTASGTTHYGGAACEISRIDASFKYIFVVARFASAYNAEVKALWGHEKLDASYAATTSLWTGGYLIASSSSSLAALSDWVEIKGCSARFEIDFAAAPTAGQTITLIAYGVR